MGEFPIKIYDIEKFVDIHCTCLAISRENLRAFEGDRRPFFWR